MWAATWLGRDVKWSGHVPHVEPDGRMVPVTAGGAGPARTDAPTLPDDEVETVRAAGS